MLNKDKYTALKKGLTDTNDSQKRELLNAFQEELTYELTELYINNKKEELDKELHLFKRYKKLLESYIEHDISYQIGTIVGLVFITGVLEHKSKVKNDIDIRMSALFSKKLNHKILTYLYNNPGSQHKVISQALEISSTHLSQQMRELEEAGGVVRYGVDRRSFYQLTLNGQAFIEKKIAENNTCFINNADYLEEQTELYKMVDFFTKDKAEIGNYKTSDKVKNGMIDVDIIRYLDKSDSNWLQYIKANDNDGIVHNTPIIQFQQNIMSQFFSKQNDINLEDCKWRHLLYDSMINNYTTSCFSEKTEKFLIHYNAMKPVRILEKSNSRLCEDFLKDVMENYVCRWSIDCSQRFHDYNFSDSDEMQNAMKSLVMLSNFYVGKAFSSEMIREHFYSETGLSKYISDYYAGLLNNNYQDIKLNLILQKIESLDQKMNKLFKQTSTV